MQASFALIEAHRSTLTALDGGDAPDYMRSIVTLPRDKLTRWTLHLSGWCHHSRWFSDWSSCDYESEGLEPEERAPPRSVIGWLGRHRQHACARLRRG